MTRIRSTWQEPRVAARAHTADPYSMNQEHPQPAVNEYESGSPDTWAETPSSSVPADSEYKGGAVIRNELGLPEFRSDTWDHKDSAQWGGGGRYDNHRSAASHNASVATRIAGSISSNQVSQKSITSALMNLPTEHLASISKHIPAPLSAEGKLKKSIACTRLASNILGTENEGRIERLARELFKIRDTELKAVVAAYSIIAKEEEEEEEEEKKQAQQQQQAQQQEQQAQQQEQQAQQQEQQAQQQCMSQEEQQAHGMTAPELAMIAELLEQEAGVPGADMGGAPMDCGPDISFGEPAPAAPAAPGVVATTASAAPSLDSLFADEPEVSTNRQASTGSYANTRVASAKKLGNVVTTPGKTDLSSIW